MSRGCFAKAASFGCRREMTPRHPLAVAIIVPPRRASAAVSWGRFDLTKSVCCQREPSPVTPTGDERQSFCCEPADQNINAWFVSRCALSHPQRRVFGDISLWHQKDGAAAKRPRRHFVAPAAIKRRRVSAITIRISYFLFLISYFFIPPRQCAAS